jgi:hypothetical protein
MQPRFNENKKELSPNLTLSRPVDLPVTMFPERPVPEPPADHTGRRAV